MWSDELDHVQKHRLIQAYMLRTRMEAKTYAQAFINEMYGDREESGSDEGFMGM